MINTSKKCDNISDDQIIKDWTLSNEDKNIIIKASKSYRSYVAFQLCSLRLYGRFLKELSDISELILIYINKQLSLPITSPIKKPNRKATYLKYRKLIFDHLGFISFDDKSKKLLENWIVKKDHSSLLPEKLYPEAEYYLISNKIALPSSNQLKRFINSICSNYHNEVFKKIIYQSSNALTLSIEEILNIAEGESVTWFHRLKEYPPSASISSIKYYLEKYRKLLDIPIGQIDLSSFDKSFITHLHKLGKYYSAGAIKRFKPEKKRSIMIAFLSESKKIILDYLVQMHDQYISDICRQCNNIHEQNLKKYKKQNETSLKTIESFIDYTLDLEDSNQITLSEIYNKTINKSELQQARDNMKQYRIESKYGYTNLLQNRYQSMRRYFSDFIKLLPIKAEEGSESLIYAIEIIKKLDNGELKSLPENTPYDFMDNDIKREIFDKDKHHKNRKIKRNLWEIGIAIAIKNALKSGNLYIPESKQYISFWNMIYDDKQWEEKKESAYNKLELKRNPVDATKVITTNFTKSVLKSKKDFDKDDFAEIKNDKLKLHKKDKMEEPMDIQRLQKILDSSLPKIKIEQLLIEVDKMTNFSKHFIPIHQQKSTPQNFYKTLMASILSQATNIGISTMQDCTTNITSDMIRHVIDSHINEDTIVSANTEIVNQHNSLQFSNVYGEGELSSSDGQRFAVKASSLLSSYYPRYFGYYEKAIGIYTHISDQYSVFNTKAISCSPREALYVLDGLLENNTILNIKEHTTDTEGYTEHIFALSSLLGYRFMPRIKDLKDQQLYRIKDNSQTYGKFNPLLNKYVDLNLIQEQWDQMVKVVASLKDRLTPAHEIIKKLSKGSYHDRLSKAFTHLGRLLKTQHILEYITNPELRLKIQRQLNKGEHRHSLSRWIFFANQGKFQIGDYEEIMNKASCLSLVSNAVLYWNTVKMSNIIDELRNNRENISDETISHISPLAHKHVIPMGTYFVDYDYSMRDILGN